MFNHQDLRRELYNVIVIGKLEGKKLLSRKLIFFKPPPKKFQNGLKEIDPPLSI